MPKTKVNTTYAQMGMAALLPGMQYMVEQMQAQLDDFKQQLAELQGQQPGQTRWQTTGRSGWPDDPEERKREMQRRMAVRRQNQMDPSDLSKKRKADWAKLSPAKRKARLAAMAAGKQKPSVKLEVAS